MSKTTGIEIMAKKADEEMRNIFNLSEIFHEATKLNSVNQAILGKRIMSVIRDDTFKESAPLSYKTYTSADRILLPRIGLPETELSYDEILRKRRSVRNFTNTPIQIKQISKILLQSYGITDFFTAGHGKNMQMLRSAPSGGSLFPIEIYVVPINVVGLEEGLYHYNVKLHALELLKKGSQKLKIPEITSFADIILDSGFLILMTSVFYRTVYKYGERGYRFVHLDAGHLAQNIYLCATSLNLGAVALGGFFDDEANDYLDVDGVTEAVIYEMAIGVPNFEEDIRLIPSQQNPISENLEDKNDMLRD